MQCFRGLDAGLVVVLRGEAVLLSSAAEVVHGHPLHVGGDLDVVWIRNQIRETCEQDENTEHISDYSHYGVSR